MMKEPTIDQYLIAGLLMLLLTNLILCTGIIAFRTIENRSRRKF